MLADIRRLLTPVTAMSTVGTPRTPLLPFLGIRSLGGCGTRVGKPKSWSCGERARHEDGDIEDSSCAPFGDSTMANAAVAIVHIAVSPDLSTRLQETPTRFFTLSSYAETHTM